MLNFPLESVEHRVAKRARGHHGVRSCRFRRYDVLSGKLDGDALVVRRGMESAAFGAAAVVNRPTAENLCQGLESGIIAGVDKSITSGWTGDVTAIKGGHSQVSERIRN